MPEAHRFDLSRAGRDGRAAAWVFGIAVLGYYLIGYQLMYPGDGWLMTLAYDPEAHRSRLRRRSSSPDRCSATFW